MTLTIEKIEKIISEYALSAVEVNGDTFYVSAAYTSAEAQSDTPIVRILKLDDYGAEDEELTGDDLIQGNAKFFILQEVGK